MQKFPPTTNRYKTTVELSKFSEHRITFDLADLAFEKSDPNRRNKSDRTMNIQSMLVIVDSLSGEISKQFDNVMSLTNTLPDVNRGNEGRINRFQDTFDTEKDTTLLTGSIVVNSQSKLKDQKKLFQRSISNLNNYKASLQNVQANINFRTKSVNRYLVEIHKRSQFPLHVLCL
jgi:lipopolysaccharide export system permease protein